MEQQVLIDGMPVVAIEPGSSDDPFIEPSVVPSNPVVASPAIAQIGQAQTALEEGKVPPAASQQPVATPAPAVPAVTQTTPESETPLQLAIKNGTLDEYISGQLGTAVESVRRELQSSADKRISALQGELREAREAEQRRTRDAKLADENLTDEEKALLRDKWELDDEKAALVADIEEADGFYRTMFVAGLAQEAKQFGVTAELLEQFAEPEEMEAYVQTKELEFYKSGAHLTPQVPTNAVVANPTGDAPAAPAGASAPTDIGGGAPASPPAKLEEGQGIDFMTRNLNKSEWISVPLPA